MILTREGILDAELSPSLARLNRIARQLQEAQPLDSTERRFLADALAAIVQGADPREALALEKARGRPKLTGQQAGKWFEAVVDVEILRRSEGQKLEDVLRAVAKKRSLAEATLKDWHKKDRRDAIWILDFLAHQEQCRTGKK